MTSICTPHPDVQHVPKVGRYLAAANFEANVLFTKVTTPQALMA